MATKLFFFSMKYLIALFCLVGLASVPPRRRGVDTKIVVANVGTAWLPRCLIAGRTISRESVSDIFPRHHSVPVDGDDFRRPKFLDAARKPEALVSARGCVFSPRSRPIQSLPPTTSGDIHRPYFQIDVDGCHADILRYAGSGRIGLGADDANNAARPTDET